MRRPGIATPAIITVNAAAKGIGAKERELLQVGAQEKREKEAEKIPPSAVLRRPSDNLAGVSPTVETAVL